MFSLFQAAEYHLASQQAYFLSGEFDGNELAASLWPHMPQAGWRFTSPNPVIVPGSVGTFEPVTEHSSESENPSNDSSTQTNDDTIDTSESDSDESDDSSSSGVQTDLKPIESSLVKQEKEPDTDYSCTNESF